MGIDSHYGDEDVKEEGKWFPLKGEDTELLIRHASNDDYIQYLMENMSQAAREVLSMFAETEGAIETDGEFDINEDAAEEVNDVLREGAAHHILVDWKNLTIDDPELADEFDKKPGENIGYTTERAKKLFELIPDFYNEVKRIAQDQAAFKKEKRKHDKGN